MPTVRRCAENMTRREWSVVLLLLASVTINYIDRSNLGIAAPVPKAEVKGRVSIYRHEGGGSIF